MTETSVHVVKKQTNTYTLTQATAQSLRQNNLKIIMLKSGLRECLPKGLFNTNLPPECRSPRQPKNRRRFFRDLSQCDRGHTMDSVHFGILLADGSLFEVGGFTPSITHPIIRSVLSDLDRKFCRNSEARWLTKCQRQCPCWDQLLLAVVRRHWCYSFIGFTTFAIQAWVYLYRSPGRTCSPSRYDYRDSVSSLYNRKFTRILSSGSFTIMCSMQLSRALDALLTFVLRRPKA